jgi:hypothetical protein
VFDRLFGGKTTDRALARSALGRRVGTSDRRRLDQHLRGDPASTVATLNAHGRRGSVRLQFFVHQKRPFPAERPKS